MGVGDHYNTFEGIWFWKTIENIKYGSLLSSSSFLPRKSKSKSKYFIQFGYGYILL
jgi:hypothetical protein